MRRILVALTIAAILVLAPIGTTLAASSTHSAGPGTIVTHRSGVEYFPMSASMCAFAKAYAKKADPRLARDPKLCEMEHGWTETDTMAQSAPTSLSGLPGVAVAQASGCPGGTATFHDWINDVDHVFWQYDLDTSYSWNWNCAAPTLNYKQCYLDWSNNTSFSPAARCYAYHYNGSGWVSTATVETVYPCTSIAGFTTCSTDSQRRECYSNGGASSCKWTAWQGA
jgi:hypothetical protein